MAGYNQGACGLEQIQPPEQLKQRGSEAGWPHLSSWIYPLLLLATAYASKHDATRNRTGMIALPWLSLLPEKRMTLEEDRTPTLSLQQEPLFETARVLSFSKRVFYRPLLPRALWRDELSLRLKSGHAIQNEMSGEIRRPRAREKQENQSEWSELPDRSTKLGPP